MQAREGLLSLGFAPLSPDWTIAGCLQSGSPACPPACFNMPACLAALLTPGKENPSFFAALLELELQAPTNHDPNGGRSGGTGKPS